MQNEKEQFKNCPVFTVQKIIGGKWSILVLHYLGTGTLRFGELHRLLPMMTQSALTKELRNLEGYHLIRRKVYPEVPPKVEYSLTDIGRKLLPILNALGQWGETYTEYAKVIESQ